jgi:hypothetical protein
MDLEELSLGKEATAEVRVLNSPDVLVPARTTIAPEGGDVREAAYTTWLKELRATEAAAKR